MVFLMILFLVSLTQTRKKGLELKQKLIDQVSMLSKQSYPPDPSVLIKAGWKILCVSRPTLLKGAGPKCFETIILF